MLGPSALLVSDNMMMLITSTVPAQDSVLSPFAAHCVLRLVFMAAAKP